MAGSTTATYSHTQIRGSSQQLDNVSLKVGANVNVPALTPMALSNADNLIYPYDPAGANGLNRALYLTAFAVDTTAGAAKKSLYRQGGFNREAINWPAATNTEDLQNAVFAGTPIAVHTLAG